MRPTAVSTRQFNEQKKYTFRWTKTKHNSTMRSLHALFCLFLSTQKLPEVSFIRLFPNTLCSLHITTKTVYFVNNYSSIEILKLIKVNRNGQVSGKKRHLN